MELHKSLLIDKSRYNLSLQDNYLEYFDKALQFVNENYKEDYDRIANTKFDEITPKFVFREIQWCIYTSGFNSKIVSKLFPALREALAPLEKVFISFETGINTLDVANNVLSILNNKRKVKSIIKIAFDGGKEINQLGWLAYKSEKLSSPGKLMELPFIGPITCNHLARNIGLLNFVKADLHLNRLASNWNFENPDILCREIQKHYNIELGLIDLVLFYAASTFGTK